MISLSTLRVFSENSDKFLSCDNLTYQWMKNVSFFDGLKQGLKKVKDGLTKPNMGFAIFGSKENYFLGEDIEGTIALEPHEYVEIQQAMVRLSCIENVKKTRQIKKSKRSYDYYRKAYVTTEEIVPEEYWDTAKLHDECLIYNLRFNIGAGENRQTPFKINIPITGRPTYNSIDSRVNWILSVEVKSKGRRSLHQSYTVQVANIPPQTSPATQAPIFIQKETIREIEVIYCSHCGTKNNARSTFCTHCGAPLH